MIYDFLYKPKNILTELRREQSRLEGFQQTMYPSGIRYDTDKVISSPRDLMPEYAAKVDEILDTIKKLKLEYYGRHYRQGYSSGRHRAGSHHAQVCRTEDLERDRTGV